MKYLYKKYYKISHNSLRINLGNQISSSMKIETDGKLHHVVPLIVAVLAVAVEIEPF